MLRDLGTCEEEMLDMPVPGGLMEPDGTEEFPDEPWRRVCDEKLPPTCQG